MVHSAICAYNTNQTGFFPVICHRHTTEKTLNFELQSTRDHSHVQYTHLSKAVSESIYWKSMSRDTGYTKRPL